MTTNPTPEKSAVLRQADEIIHGQRLEEYGDASESFQRLADLWTPILGVQVTPAQVALCLVQLKILRLLHTPDHTDSWVDAAAYIALGAEVVEQ